MVWLNLATWILVATLFLPFIAVEGLFSPLKTSTKSSRSRGTCTCTCTSTSTSILSRIPAVPSRNVRRKASKKDLEEEEEAEVSKIKDPKFLERNKRWVLIVDDEEAIRMAVGDYLYDQGYQVTACADADSLLEICAKLDSDGDLPVVPDAIIRSVGSFVRSSHCL
jgi:hypothetical protein